jgi:toluene monooxygenase system ferredoxin subunit
MSWKPVCSTHAVEQHTLREFDVDGIPVLIANLGDGFRAYPPMCPHMEEPLAESGICKQDVMTCTKHLWQWNLRTGEGVSPAENNRQMLMYDIKQEDDQLMVFVENELEYDFDDEDDEED